MPAADFCRPAPRGAAWTSPSFLELLPELSDEEKRRMRRHGVVPETDVYDIPWRPTRPMGCIGMKEASIISTVRDVVNHYNATHPDDEFDVVKTLTHDGVRFRSQVWLHMNFWARSRRSSEIERFFAEIRYQPPPRPDSTVVKMCATVVESCCIIREPLSQCSTTCAFCREFLDILHPTDREFVCGSGNADDWVKDKLLGTGIPVIYRRDPADTNAQEKADRTTESSN